MLRICFLQNRIKDIHLKTTKMKMKTKKMKMKKMTTKSMFTWFLVRHLSFYYFDSEIFDYCVVWFFVVDFDYMYIHMHAPVVIFVVLTGFSLLWLIFRGFVCVCVSAFGWWNRLCLWCLFLTLASEEIWDFGIYSELCSDLRIMWCASSTDTSDWRRAQRLTHVSVQHQHFDYIELCHFLKLLLVSTC